MDIRKYYKIYRSFIDSDIIEYNIVKNDKELSIKYMSILSIANINYRINMKCNSLITNRYISKCMVLTNVISIKNLEFIIYLFDRLKKYDDEKSKKYLSKDKKTIEKIDKIYNFFY